MKIPISTLVLFAASAAAHADSGPPRPGRAPDTASAPPAAGIAACQIGEPCPPVPPPSPPPPSEPPSAPGALRADDVRSTSLVLRWQDTSTNENYFQVQRRLPTETIWTAVHRVERDVTGRENTGQTLSVTDARLNSDTRYCYRVVAGNQRGSTASEALCVTTARAELKARLRLLTHNVWGVDDRQCDLRAKRFGDLVANASPAYDIVGLQEYYSSADADLFTCDAEHLSDAIWSTGRYRNANNYDRFYPEGEAYELEADGGIGIFSLHPIIAFEEWEWDGYKGPFKPVEGFIFARIRIPNTGVTVDTYVVHFWAGGDGDRGDRLDQLEKLASTIKQRSRNTGNPVIVMGDFNIGGPPDDAGNCCYQDILQKLGNPRDLWLETHPANPGYTYDCFENTNAGDCDERKRIDYVFLLTDPRFTTSPYEIIVEPSTVQLMKERVTTPPYGHFISDHFGIEATIDIRL